jgi:ribosomal-protein-alanine N-acetyltransferase
LRPAIVELRGNHGVARPATDHSPGAAAARPSSSTTGPAPIEWRSAAPVLSGALTTLRELKTDDAPALLELLSSDEVSRFISAPPATVEAFERFIRWGREQRAAGAQVAYAVLDASSGTTMGLIQIRRLDASFTVAEWGFVLGSQYWGSGRFMDAAQQALRFAFETLGVHRLEARAAVENGRGAAVLTKLGAVQEAVLRKSLHRNGRYFDQALWAILRRDWLRRRAAAAFVIH